MQFKFIFASIKAGVVVLQAENLLVLKITQVKHTRAIPEELLFWFAKVCLFIAGRTVRINCSVLDAVTDAGIDLAWWDSYVNNGSLF